MGADWYKNKLICGWKLETIMLLLTDETINSINDMDNALFTKIKSLFFSDEETLQEEVIKTNSSEREVIYNLILALQSWNDSYIEDTFGDTIEDIIEEGKPFKGHNFLMKYSYEQVHSRMEGTAKTDTECFLYGGFEVPSRLGISSIKDMNEIYDATVKMRDTHFLWITEAPQFFIIID